MRVLLLLKKYNTHSKKVVTATRIKFNPKGFIKPPLIKYFTVVKLRAKKILVTNNARCAFVFVVNWKGLKRKKQIYVLSNRPI